MGRKGLRYSTVLGTAQLLAVVLSLAVSVKLTYDSI